jgi:hypothetical protein
MLPTDAPYHPRDDSQREEVCMPYYICLLFCNIF